MTAADRMKSLPAVREADRQAILARAEIEDAIDAVIHGQQPVAKTKAWPDMNRCWRCGSDHLALLRNRALDRVVTWCMDCGKSWLERRL